MSRVGNKRSDKRWVAPDGVVWASKWEYDTYEYLKTTKVNVRKCGKGDSFNYCEPLKRARCLACGSDQVGQDRIFTPDLHISFPSPKGDGTTTEYYLETKGYFSPPKRRLFATFLKERPDVSIRILYQTNAKATSKLRNLDYAARYFKIPALAGLDQLKASDWVIT